MLSQRAESKVDKHIVTEPRAVASGLLLSTNTLNRGPVATARGSVTAALFSSYFCFAHWLLRPSETSGPGDLIAEISLEKDTSRDVNSKGNKTLAALKIIIVDRC